MEDSHFAVERQQMVANQIVSRGILDQEVLAAMKKVPRHEFIPPSMASYAYSDCPLPIGEGQTISQPFIVALMLQAAELRPQETLLEIGTGSGYAAAVASQIVRAVTTVERIPSLSERAKKVFEKLQYSNIELHVGDGSLGFKEKAPYSAIIVTAGAPIVPESLLEQLEIGGRIIIPVGPSDQQELLRLRKTGGGECTKEFLEFVRFVPLIGKEGWNE